MSWIPQNILAKLANGEPQTLLFSSCQSGAGTTHTLIESALAFHSQYPMYKFLLVDFNTVNKTLSQQSSESEGWQTALRVGTFTCDKLAHLNGHDEIAVLPSTLDSTPTSPIELSNGLKMLKKCMENYDLILVDSPPVLPSTLGSFFGEKGVDGVILVVEAGKTRRPVIRESISSIKNFNGPLLGIILNRRKHLIPEWLYQYFF